MINLAEDRTMDAANLSFKRISLSLSVAFALLMPAAAYAQPAFALSPTSITLTRPIAGKYGGDQHHSDSDRL